MEQLDTAEGLGKGYEHRWVQVRLENSEAISALTYVGTDLADDLQPYDWYMKYVLEGAREHGLPPDYIRALEELPTQADGRPAVSRKE
jgi:cation transport regulator ChaC